MPEEALEPAETAETDVTTDAMTDLVPAPAPAAGAGPLPSLPDGYRALVVGAGAIGAALAARIAADPRCGHLAHLHRRSEPAIDVADPDLAERAARALDGAAPLHLAIVATGMLHGPGVAPEKRLADLRGDAMAEVLRVNAIGPALLLAAIAPRLTRGRSLVGVLSARVGSVGDNRLGGWLSYRASKAALNMAVRTAAIEVRRARPEAVVAALHPDTVASNLSRPFRGDEIGTAPEAAAANLLRVLDGLAAEDSGGFFAWDGRPVPW